MNDSSLFNNYIQNNIHPEEPLLAENIPYSHRSSAFCVNGVKFKHLKYRKLKNSACKLECQTPDQE